MLEPTPDSLERTLTALEAGERAWFWFSPDTDDLSVPLLVSPVARDPGMTALLDLRDLLPATARECFGLLSVGEDGRFTFGSPATTTDLLQVLAAWTRDQLDEHPGLACNAGARFVRFDDHRIVRERYEDDTLWQGMERPALRGSLQHSAGQLAALGPGDGAPYWASEKGPGGAFLAVEPEDEEVFDDIVRRLVLRSGGRPRGVRGQVEILEDGTRSFQTESVELLCGILDAVEARGFSFGGTVAVTDGTNVWRRGETGWKRFEGGER